MDGIMNNVSKELIMQQASFLATICAFIEFCIPILALLLSNEKPTQFPQDTSR